MDPEGTVLEKVTEEIVIENDNEKDDSKAPVYETPEESARIAIEELQKQADNGEEGEETEQETEAPSVNSDVAKPELKEVAPVEEEQIDLELEPPERLDAKERAIFKRCSPQMKKMLHRVVKDLESRTHKERNEVVQKANKYRDLDAVLDPYREELLARGHNEASAVSELMKIHRGLSNPQTKKKEYIALGPKIGLSEQEVYKIQQVLGGGEVESDAENIPPHIQTLIDENKRLREMIEPIHNVVKSSRDAQIETEAQRIQGEFEGVRDEVDGFGRLTFPKLSEDPQYFNRARPLVTALKESDPGLSYGDALRQAYNIIEKRTGYLSQNQTKPSAAKLNGKTTTRLMSVRGHTSMGDKLSDLDDDIKPGETPEESARIVVERLSRGVH